MKIFVADSNNTQRQYCRDNNIGILNSPSYFRLPPTDLDYILDNGAFIAWKNKEDWNETAFYNCLKRLQQDNVYPYFIVVPDLVTKGLESLEHSKKHLKKLPKAFKKYLPVQDGVTIDHISNDITNQIDGIFVGGSLDWKWKTAKDWIDYAHKNNLKCHIGRVGTKKDYMRAYILGADSVDGSAPTRNRNLYIIPEFYEWVTEQQSIFSYNRDYRYENLYKGLFGDW